MNRTDRLLSIIMELQRTKIVTADALAKKYVIFLSENRQENSTFKMRGA
ncbi:hypothetical protein [Bacillus rhizoplanae]